MWNIRWGISPHRFLKLISMIVIWLNVTYPSVGIFLPSTSISLISTFVLTTWFASNENFGLLELGLWRLSNKKESFYHILFAFKNAYIKLWLETSREVLTSKITILKWSSYFESGYFSLNFFSCACASAGHKDIHWLASIRPCNWNLTNWPSWSADRRILHFHHPLAAWEDDFQGRGNEKL